MALVNVCRFASLYRKLSSSNCVLQVRHAGYQNRDWKPAPYPKTEEQRRAAAKKYNLIYEDYEPYPDDGTGWGDYPKLPVIHADRRDQFQHFDNPEYKRNYGEPLHIDFDELQHDRPDPNQRFRYGEGGMWLQTFAFIGGFLALWYIFEPYPTIRPAMPKQLPVPSPESHIYHEVMSPMILSMLPKPGEVHYTFEPEDS